MTQDYEKKLKFYKMADFEKSWKICSKSGGFSKFLDVAITDFGVF